MTPSVRQKNLAHRFHLALLSFLVGVLRNLDFIVNVFPLHDKEEIKLIERDWFMSKGSLFKSQDIRKATLQLLFRY
jgi:hypothetical protein